MGRGGQIPRVRVSTSATATPTHYSISLSMEAGRANLLFMIHSHVP